MDYAPSAESGVLLRDIVEADLPIFFRFQRDAAANRMAAFTARDPDDWTAFLEHWTTILADPGITLQTVVYADQVTGNIVCFAYHGQPNVGYWIGREFWGRGVATRALQLFLQQIAERPLYASVAQDNLGSRRVLEKCGFVVTGADTSFSNVRGADVSEYILMLS